MKFRNLLTLLALLVTPMVGHTATKPDKNQVQTVASAPAPAPPSSEATDLVKRLKDRVDPTYVACLKEASDHSHGPRG